MKLWILCCFLAAAAAKPSDSKPNNAEIEAYRYNIRPDGFKYIVKQSDGTESHAVGKLVKVQIDGKETEALVIIGAYSYVNNGTRYSVEYVADHYGYRATIVESPIFDKASGIGIIPYSGSYGLVVSSLLGGGIG